MKNIFLLYLSFFAFSAFAAEKSTVELFDSPREGTVQAAVLNIRVLPNRKFTTVSQLKFGDKVSIVGRKGSWYKIAAPQNSSVWLAKAYVKNARTTRNVNMRSGPGINYSSYGILNANSEVKVLNTSQSEWVKIAPPENIYTWASAGFIKIKEPPQAIAGAGISSTKTAKTTAKPLVVSLPYIPGSPAVFDRKGIIRPLSKNAVYVTHALISSDGRKTPIAYLHSDKYSLQLWLGREIQLEGKSRKVNGWKLPVVEVEKITPCW